MKLIVNGSNGRMGRTLLEVVGNGAGSGFEIVCAADPENEAASGFPIYESVRQFDGEADCLVDFSHHTAAGEVCVYAARRGIATVIAATGHTEAERSMIEAASREVPVFLCANLSLGAALISRLAARAARFFPDAQIDILETHRDGKSDLPSGTAAALAADLSRLRGGCPVVCGPRREGNGICVHSVRRGGVIGEHEVIFSCGAQTVRLVHEVHDRRVFAEGALAAARFVFGRAPGIYTMEDLLGDENCFL